MVNVHALIQIPSQIHMCYSRVGYIVKLLIVAEVNVFRTLAIISDGVAKIVNDILQNVEQSIQGWTR